MDHTLFYIAGILLILIALAISAIGMRSDDFPSNGVMLGGIAATALVVVITAFGAVILSQAESEEREEDEEAALAEEELTAENEEEGAGEPEAPMNSGEGPAEASADVGSAVFVENGCGSCHSLADLGDEALGQVGPNLDEALVDKDPAYIETSIIDPSAVVAEGFTDGIMPGGYANDIAPEDLDALVDYLSEATSEGGGGSGSGSGSGQK